MKTLNNYISLREGAELLGITLGSLRQYIKIGRVESIKIDGVRYVGKDSLNNYQQGIKRVKQSNELPPSNSGVVNELPPSNYHLVTAPEGYTKVYVPSSHGLIPKFIKNEDMKVPDWRIVKPLDGYSATLEG
jgi:hypothetical protein